MLAEPQRLSMLQAMGIDVYRRRTGAGSSTSAADAHLDADVVVVCRDEVVPSRFKAQLPRALGIGADRLQWCGVGRSVPSAAAYVVIGTEAARALGVQLSTMQQNTSIIAATAEPAMLLQGAAAKRALWQSLKAVARRLRERH